MNDPGEILLFQTEDGSSRLEVRLLNETVWLSEKEFWRKVLEIYATSIDYDPGAEASQAFFATIQNKMHWAAHGHTAAEIIRDRFNAARPPAGSITADTARALAEQEYAGQTSVNTGR